MIRAVILSFQKSEKEYIYMQNAMSLR